MSARLKRYQIRQEQKTKRDLAKLKLYSDVIGDVVKMIAQLPEEIKMSYASEILMQFRGQDHKKGSKWQHEHRQTYTLLNQAVGARNNRVNAGAFSDAIPLKKVDLLKLIGGSTNGKT